MPFPMRLRAYSKGATVVPAAIGAAFYTQTHEGEELTFGRLFVLHRKGQTRAGSQGLSPWTGWVSLWYSTVWRRETNPTYTPN